MDDVDRAVKETLRYIRTAKIRKPTEGEHVGRCHWSRTGWAIHKSHGACTCEPARALRGDAQRKHDADYDARMAAVFSSMSR